MKLRAIASIGKLVADEIDHEKAARYFDLLVEEVNRSQAVTKLVVGLIPNSVSVTFKNALISSRERKIFARLLPF